MDYSIIISSFSDTICQQISFLGLSLSGKIWSMIISQSGTIIFWVFILGILIWSILEIVSIGSSVNGFSRQFNSFVGATLYFFITWAIFFVLDYFTSGLASCLYIPFIHPTVIILVWIILRSLGFWKY